MQLLFLFLSSVDSVPKHSSFSCIPHFYNRMGCPRNTLEDFEILKTCNIQRFS